MLFSRGAQSGLSKKILGDTSQIGDKSQTGGDNSQTGISIDVETVHWRKVTTRHCVITLISLKARAPAEKAATRGAHSLLVL